MDTESRSPSSSPRNSNGNETSSTSDSNSPIQVQNQAANRRRTNNAQSTTPMHDILKLIEENKISLLYENKNLHYYFLKHCVINVVSIKRWKENISRYDYSRFVHPSDEGFALVVLENNIIRYREMRDRELEMNEANNEDDDDDDHDYTQPLYTVVTKKGRKSSGKGWTDKGKMRFQEFTQFVRNKRQNERWMEDRNNAIKSRALRDFNESNKRQRLDFDAHNDEPQMSKNEETAWNQFLSDNINDSEWLNNAIGV